MDKYLGPAPFFTLLGLALALTVSMMGVWKVVKKLQAIDAAIPTTKQAIESGERWRKEEEAEKAAK